MRHKLLVLLCGLLLTGCTGGAPGAASAPISEAPPTPAAAEKPEETLTEAPFYIEIYGYILYRERIALAPNFVCAARLLDMDAPDGPKVMDSTVIPGPLSIPLRYRLQMEGYTLDISHTYAVEAFIFAPKNPDAPDPANGTVLFRSREPVPVLTKGRPAKADIILTMQPGKP